MIFDSVVPRGGAVPPYIFVDLETFLARLTALRRKCLMVEYRRDQWRTATDSASADFQKLTNGWKWPATEYPPGARVVLRFSTVHQGLESEFESVLHAVRSGYDILARVVAASLPGMRDTKSFTRLVTIMLGRADRDKLASAILAGSQEFVELRARRDAASHYTGVTVTSEVVHEHASDGTRTSADILIRIPASPDESMSVSVWHDFVPTIGGTAVSSSSIVLQDGSSVEAHALFDEAGRLIVRRNGPLPAPPETTDAREYVDKVTSGFLGHVADVLSAMARSST